MKHYRLKHEEARGLGYTDLFMVFYTDFSSTALAVAEALTLTALATGDLVANNVLVEVKTHAAGLTVADGTVELSTGGTLLETSNLLAAGDLYFVSGAGTAALPALSAANLVFVITPNAGMGTEQAVVDISAGEFWVWATIKRKADRAIQV